MSKIRLGGSRQNAETPATTRGDNYITRANTYDAPPGNFPLAFLGGLAIAAVCAYFWPQVSRIPRVSNGYIALGAALFIGLAVRICGRGTQSVYGMTAATLFLLACLGGNMITYTVYEQHLSWFHVGKDFKLQPFVEWITPLFKPVDLALCAVGLFVAYRLAYKKHA